MAGCTVIHDSVCVCSEHMIYLVAVSENGGDPSKFQFFSQSVCSSNVKFSIRVGVSFSLKLFEPKCFNFINKIEFSLRLNGCI